MITPDPFQFAFTERQRNIHQSWPKDVAAVFSDGIYGFNHELIHGDLHSFKEEIQAYLATAKLKIYTINFPAISARAGREFLRRLFEGLWNHNDIDAGAIKWAPDIGAEDVSVVWEMAARLGIGVMRHWAWSAVSEKFDSPGQLLTIIDRSIPLQPISRAAIRVLRNLLRDPGRRHEMIAAMSADRAAKRARFAQE